MGRFWVRVGYPKPIQLLFHPLYLCFILKLNTASLEEKKVFNKQDEMLYKYKLVNMSKLDLPDWHDWVDAEDVIEKLHITPRTLQRWRINGMLPCSRINGKCYYRKSDVLVLLMDNYNGVKGGGDE